MANHILIVDDDYIVRDELKGVLEEYEIIEAGSGEAAIQILNKPNEIDVVILDVRMPGLNGIETLQKIRSGFPSLGIIILTGFGTKDTVIEALRGEADDYLEKPVDALRIKQSVEKILDAKQLSGNNLDISSTQGKIEKLKRFVERNCFKKLCLKDSAQAVCLSPKYASRLFKQSMGMSFSEYRLRVKIEKAKELLLQNNFNVNQVSDKLGYANTESFIRQFKRFMKCTPSEYRLTRSKNKRLFKSGSYPRSSVPGNKRKKVKRK